MERGSNKTGSQLEDQRKKEAEPLERSGREARAEEHLEKEASGISPEQPDPAGHRIQGSGSSADSYTYRDHGEVGGKSHPKPSDSEESS